MNYHLGVLTGTEYDRNMTGNKMTSTFFLSSPYDPKPSTIWSGRISSLKPLSSSHDRKCSLPIDTTSWPANFDQYPPPALCPEYGLPFIYFWSNEQNVPSAELRSPGLKSDIWSRHFQKASHLQQVYQYRGSWLLHDRNRQSCLAGVLRIW